MIKRCVEISSGPARLSVSMNQLVLKRDGGEIGRIPLEDLGVLIVDNPSVTYTHSALSSLLSRNIAVVLCGADHHPVGMLMPLDGHSVQARTFAGQVSATARVKKRVWKEIVSAKIMGQAHALGLAGHEAEGFRALAGKVRSGDPDNIEARAARRYWPLLFGRGFCRAREGPPPNNLLNYGYMVLRAAAARAICGAGLHPSLGVHHRNKYNPFVLADDFMEPMRPFVDAVVYRLWQEGLTDLTSEAKFRLLGTLSAPVKWNGGRAPLMVALSGSAASLRGSLTGEGGRLELPGPL